LFEEAKLIEFLIENLTFFDPKSKMNKNEKSYIGHLVNLANLLNYDGKFNGSIFDLVKYLTKNEEWQDFITLKLSKINEICECELGGFNPRKQKKANPYLAQKEEIDDFDLLFIENQKTNEKESFQIYENELNEISEPQNNNINNEEIQNFFMKYEEEKQEKTDIEEEYNLMVQKISSMNLNE